MILHLNGPDPRLIDMTTYTNDYIAKFGPCNVWSRGHKRQKVNNDEETEEEIEEAIREAEENKNKVLIGKSLLF